MVPYAFAISRNTRPALPLHQVWQLPANGMRNITLAPMRRSGRNTDCASVTTLPSAGPSLLARALARTRWSDLSSVIGR